MNYETSVNAKHAMKNTNRCRNLLNEVCTNSFIFSY